MSPKQNFFYCCCNEKANDYGTGREVNVLLNISLHTNQVNSLCVSPDAIKDPLSLKPGIENTHNPRPTEEKEGFYIYISNIVFLIKK